MKLYELHYLNIKIKSDISDVKKCILLLCMINLSKFVHVVMDRRVVSSLWPLLWWPKLRRGWLWCTPCHECLRLS